VQQTANWNSAAETRAVGAAALKLFINARAVSETLTATNGRVQ